MIYLSRSKQPTLYPSRLQAQGVLFCYTVLILEYFSLLNLADKPETPLYEKRGILDIVSRMEPYLSPEQFQRYQQVSQTVRSELSRTLIYAQ